MSADALPTVQVNGVVWAQAIVGDWVYAGGQFTSARPAGAAPGENETPRSNFLRYNLQTGQLDASFDVPLNGQVLAIAASPDGSRVYVGGSFTQADGVAHPRLVALDARTGTVVGTFTSGTNATVFGIAATDDTVWITGAFSQLNATPRAKIAAVNAATGAVLPFTAVLEGGDAPVGRSIIVDPAGNRVVVSGSFARANGSSSPGRGLAMLDAVTGGSLALPANSVIRAADRFSGIAGLDSDADSFYGTGSSQGADGFEGTFRASWATGELVWTDACRGGANAVAAAGGAVYQASHARRCSNPGGLAQSAPSSYDHALAFAKDPAGAAPAARLLHWYPTFDVGSATGQNEATWSVEAGGGYVVYGGEFPTVQGTPQQGLARFATSDSAPNAVAPTASGFTASVTSTRAASARIAWVASFDTDNADLRYEVYRNDRPAPIATRTATSTRWVRPALDVTDSEAVPGTTYRYRVRASDPFGNDAFTPWQQVRVSDADTATAYTDAVLADAPVSYWPLDEPGGARGRDWVSGRSLSLGSVARSADGPLAGSPSRSTSFFGTAASAGSTTAALPGPQEFTVEAWIRTSSNQGGLIVGFGSSPTGASTSHDRSISIDQAGTLTFAVTPSTAVKTIVSAPGYNDDRWHHVVGSVGPFGMTFSVDGVRAGSVVDTTTAGAYAGYWRVGSDTLAGLPDGAAQSALAGQIADVAVYPRALSAAQVDAHWVASGRASTAPTRPDDAYGQMVYDLQPSLYWRFDERVRREIADSGPGPLPGRFTSDGRLGDAAAVSARGTPVRGARDALQLTPRFAGLFGQDTKALGATARSIASPGVFAVEGWFSTTTTAGGKLFGFQDTPDFGAAEFDRAVFMNEAGQVSFGTFNGTENTVTSRARYNDGTWHHVVAQQSGAGMELYLDGERVASNRVTTANAYAGFWVVGGGKSWAGAGAWTGRIDEFAVYDRALTRNEVLQHRQVAATGSFDSPPTSVISAVVSGDTVRVDGSASRDAQGEVAAYVWSFGDGATATGASAAHAYAVAGTYTVMLTVTDAAGFSTTGSQTVTVAALQVAPVAAFAARTAGQRVSVDASAATVADRRTTSYAWSFGDGATATGISADHAYARAGEYPVTLTVTDARGSSATTVQRVTVTASGPSTPPPVSFTAAADGLVARFDARASADPADTVTAYQWDFGDGAVGSGVAPSHPYAASGSYVVTLRVTDAHGARQSVSQPVAVTVAGDRRLAADTFRRSVSGAWGAADDGGSWELRGGDAAFSVADGRGRITLAPSDTREARLPAVSATDTIVTAVVNTDQVATRGAASITVHGRAVGNEVYSARLRFEPGNVVRVYLLQGERSLGDSSVVLEGGYRAGENITVQLAVSGITPTTLGVKAWRAGAPAPADWQLQATDETLGLQTAGTVGVNGSLSAQSTTTPITLGVAGLTVERDPLRVPADANRHPNPTFTVRSADLTAAFDASGSRDPDGVLARYAWDFGDGQSGIGQTTAHTYAAPGAYPVTLTATDDRGASTSSTVTALVRAAPLSDGTVARDAFNRLVNGGWGAADVGGDWAVDGGSGAFDVVDGRGTITLEPSWTRQGVLPGAGGTDTNLDALVSVDRAVTGSGAVGATLVGRAVGDAAYQARLRFEADGTMRLFIARDEVALDAGYVLPGTWTPGTPVNIRLSVTGTAPTTIAAKAWADGSPEPTRWQRSATDGEPVLQAAGAVGIRGSLSSSATNARIVLSVDRFQAMVD